MPEPDPERQRSYEAEDPWRRKDGDLPEASATAEGDSQREDQQSTLPITDPAEKAPTPQETLMPNKDGVTPVEGSGRSGGVATEPSLSHRFQFIRDHAQGGLGRVWLGRDTALRRPVAVKEILTKYADTADSRARFIFEAEVTGRLEHPGIVPIYTLAEYRDGRPYYAMRFISGNTMGESIRELHATEDPELRQRRLRELLNRFISVCNTVDYAHSRGYIHRDLKPSNVMLGAFAETLVVDWGLAKFVGAPAGTGDRSGPLDADGARGSEGAVASGDPQATYGHGDASNGLPPTVKPDEREDDPAPSSAATVEHSASTDPSTDPSTEPHAPAEGVTHLGSRVGTPNYMSPEQAAGTSHDVGCPTDIYALGATLYQILTGRAPLVDGPTRSPDAILKRVRSGQVPPPRAIRGDVAKPLDAICRKAMAFAPADRYGSARALAADIENYLSDQPVSVLPESIWQRSSRWMRKHRGITATAAAAVMLLALVSSLAYAVTQQSLARTQRLLAIERVERRFDDLVANENRRITSAKDPMTIPLQQSTVDQAVQLIADIERLQQQRTPGFRDRARRTQLLQLWSGSIERFSDKRLDRPRQQRLVAEVARFEQDYPFQGLADFLPEVARLSELAESRVVQWYALPAPSLPDDAFEPAGATFVRTSQDGQSPALLGDAPVGNLQVSASFAGDMAQARLVGLGLTRQSDPAASAFGGNEPLAYQFVLADEQYDPKFGDMDLRSIESANRLGTLRAMIVRGEDVLRKTPVELPPMAAGQRRELPPLTARREAGTQLAFRVGDLLIEFEDLFPIAASEVGQFALLCPAGVAVRDLAIEAQTAIEPAAKLSPIERGDRAFAAGDYREAIEQYGQLEKNIEARTKRAIALQYVDIAEFGSELREIFEGFSPEAETDPDYLNWYLYACVRLYLHYLDQSDEQFNASEVIGRLEDKGYKLADVQSLVPSRDLESFNLSLLKPGKRTRVLFDSIGEVEELENTIELFANNTRWLRLAKWRLADAVRYDGQRDRDEARVEAAQILDSLIEEMASDGQRDQEDFNAIIADRIWVAIMQQDYRAGRELLARFLPEDPRDCPPTYLPLLIERARLTIAEDQENTDPAIDDLFTFKDRIDPRSPPVGIDYMHWGDACGILGIIYERTDRPEEAAEVWRAGRRRNWPNYKPDPEAITLARGAKMVYDTQTPEPGLAARTDGYNDQEWRDVVDELFAGSGVTNIPVRNIVFKSERLPDEWIKRVCENCFAGKKGRELADDCLLRQIGLRDASYDAVCLILYQAIVHLTLGGESVHDRFPQLDAVLWPRCKLLIDDFQEGRFDQNDMSFILAAFTGTWNEQSFVRLRESLEDDDLAAGLANIFAIMQYRKTGQLEQPRKIIENHVEPYREIVPELYFELADAFLREDAPAEEDWRSAISD